MIVRRSIVCEAIRSGVCALVLFAGAEVPVYAETRGLAHEAPYDLVLAGLPYAAPARLLTAEYAGLPTSAVDVAAGEAAFAILPGDLESVPGVIAPRIGYEPIDLDAGVASHSLTAAPQPNAASGVIFGSQDIEFLEFDSKLLDALGPLASHTVAVADQNEAADPASEFGPLIIRRGGTDPSMARLAAISSVGESQSGAFLLTGPVTVVAARAMQPASGSADPGNEAKPANDKGLRYSLDATATAGYDSNPFLILDDTAETGSGSVRLQLAPTISRSDGRNTLLLTGRVEHVEFFRRYGSFQNFGADFLTTRQVNQRLQINAGLNFVSDIPGANLASPSSNLPQAVLPDSSGVLPNLPGFPVGNDITLLGQLQRRISYGANGGLIYDLSPRDQIQWSVAFSANRFDEAGFADSDFISQRLSYSRQVSATTNLGAAIDASVINFADDAFGTVKTVSPQLLLSSVLSDFIDARVSIGLGIARTETPTVNETSVFVAGDAALCYKTRTDRLCLNGNRQVLPAGIGGALVQTTAGISYSSRLSERDTIELGGNYGVADQPLVGGGGDFETINGFARYERQLSERMRFFVNGGYQRITGGGLFDGANGGGTLETSNLQASIGLSVTFGKTR